MSACSSASAVPRSPRTLIPPGRHQPATARARCTTERDPAVAEVADARPFGSWRLNDRERRRSAFGAGSGCSPHAEDVGGRRALRAVDFAWDPSACGTILFVARSWLWWGTLSALGLVTILLPDTGPRLFSLSEAHGPSLIDSVGVLLLLGRVSKVGVSCEMLPAWDEET